VFKIVCGKLSVETDLTVCRILVRLASLHVCPEFEGSVALRNVCILLKYCMVSQPRRPRLGRYTMFWSLVLSFVCLQKGINSVSIAD